MSSLSVYIVVVTVALVVSTGARIVVKCDTYLGASLGKLNSYSNQISGEVYIIDDSTFLLKNFFYDGLAQDAFFWAGSSIRPSSKGFIVASEDGRTNKLQRYTNRDITIKLPDERRISTIRWLAIWDIRGGKNLADIIIPDEFEPPSAKKISEFTKYTTNEAVSVKSETITLLNSKLIGIEQLYYSSSSSSSSSNSNAHANATVFFLVGIGPQPNLATGIKVPDETGSLESLGSYDGENIVLELPGNLTIFDIDWLSIYDTQEQDNLASVLIPSHLSVPPALVTNIKQESRLPQCEQLHRDIQLNWDIFGPQVTFELVARIAHDEYIAFGISGSESSSQMINSDVALSYIDGHVGYTIDYNITDKHPCVALNNIQNLHNANNKNTAADIFRGVCPDTKLSGGVDNYQYHSFSRENGLTRISFRRNLLTTGDEGDKEFKTSGPTSVVWAVGKLNKFKEPRYHHLYSKGRVSIEFGRRLSKNCFQFTASSLDSPHSLNANDAAFGRRQAAALSTATLGGGGNARPNTYQSPFSLLSRLSSSSSQSSSSLQSSHLNPIQAKATRGSREQQADNDELDGTILASPFFSSSSWGQPVVVNRSATVFHARLGHPGVQKGYMRITGDGSAGLVWYINGLVAPILHVVRGKTYTFKVEAGDAFDSTDKLGYRFYHPLYITDEPFGGYMQQNLSQRLSQKVFAGLQFEQYKESVQSAANSNSSSSSSSANKQLQTALANSKQHLSASASASKPHQAMQIKMIGKPLPNSIGRLCAWLPNDINTIRKADGHQSFAQFRSKLNYNCAPNGQPGLLQWTPNVSTPDVVYYQSYSQRNMGWKIIVHDESEFEEYSDSGSS